MTGKAKDNGVTRVDLPDGEWWDIRTEGIVWGEIKQVRAELAKAQAKGLNVDLDETLLFHFTVATSKSADDKEALTQQMDALSSEDARVTVLLMDVVSDKLFPLFPGVAQSTRSLLEAFTSH